MFKIIHSLCYYHPFVTMFTGEPLMHSNLNCLLPILMCTIFPIFLTQCQFGILWIVNDLPLVFTVHLWIILEVKILLAFAVFYTCLVHTWLVVPTTVYPLHCIKYLEKKRSAKAGKQGRDDSIKQFSTQL